MALRIDRLATLYVVDPLRRVSTGKNASIPILMYHSIADEDEAGMHPYYRTATTASIFAVQMANLYNDGFSVIGPNEAVHRLRNGEFRKKSVVITFDDGFHNFYANAFPVLNRYGFTATMYLPTAHIGDSRRSFKGKECLTWSEVRELEKYGISFGSHTVTHPQLHGLRWDEIAREVRTSKDTIEQSLGAGVTSFAYPYAFPETDARFKTGLRELLISAGYSNGVCTKIGHAKADSDSYFMERLPVNSEDDTRLLDAKLAGSYDWVAGVQYGTKWTREWVRRLRG